MKRKLLFLAMATFAVVLVSSCTKHEEVYSCDPEINDWTKGNLSNISTMSRSEWLEVNEELSIAVYRAFTPTQMQNFWIEKINEVMDMDWNSKEEAHLQEMLDYVSCNYKLFDINQNEGMLDSFEIFAYKWIEYAQEELGWDKDLIGAVIANGRSLQNKDGEVIKSNNSSNMSLVKSRSEDSKLDCHCNQTYDFCTGGEGECKDKGCISKTTGCGLLWLSNCNGRCHVS